MSTIKSEAAVRRDNLYDHPSSEKRRAAEERGVNRSPEAELRRQQLNEANALGARHRAEVEKTQRRHNVEIAREVEPRGSRPSHEIEHAHRRELSDLHRKHADERAVMTRRHGDERRRLRVQAATR